MTDDTPDPKPAPVQVTMPLPPPPTSANDGAGAQSARVLGIALGGALVAYFVQSPIAAAAIIPAFGVIAVWAYGIWERRKSNREKITMHSLLSSLSGGLIQ